MIDKTQELQNLHKKFKRVVDRLGKHIDEGIMDTVVALNAVNIYTTASCEGHLDHGLPYPWIDTSSTEIYDISIKIATLLDEGKREDEETKRLQKQHRLLYLHEDLRLVALLDAFYQQHQMIYDSHLTISQYANGAPRLQSYGGYYQEFREPEERAEKLAKYQQEMRDFTAFLKQGYFEGTL